MHAQKCYKNKIINAKIFICSAFGKIVEKKEPRDEDEGSGGGVEYDDNEYDEEDAEKGNSIHIH